jgi:hypothetical protein
MAFTTRIEPRATLRTDTPTVQIFINRQLMLAAPTQDGSLVTLRNRPDARLVLLKGVVAADAGVEFPAAGVADGDDVAGRRPM